ncbi:MAG: hypothetical protein DMG14_04715 [Acidobacteria bacterium]|nr:MAG: hypothetical protein DMG14_04715 [Acidobacteriota bacterium]
MRFRPASGKCILRSGNCSNINVSRSESNGLFPKTDVTCITRKERNNVGLTVLRVKVGNPAKPNVTEELEFLVDSGAVYSVVPSRILRKLRIKPLANQEFRLADGSTITRKKGIALFKYEDRIGGADVIFGEEGDSLLLGAFTLEALGLALDPLRRELKPLPMILSGKIS